MDGGTLVVLEKEGHLEITLLDKSETHAGEVAVVRIGPDGEAFELCNFIGRFACPHPDQVVC